VKNRAKDGKSFWTENTIVPVRNEHGEIVKYSVMQYHFVDDMIASIVHEQQMKTFDIASHTANNVKKIVRNGHERTKAA
jgi:hypothetical protein